MQASSTDTIKYPSLVGKINILDEMSRFLTASKYAKYSEELKRRETWEECVMRDRDMHLKRFKDILSKDQLEKVSWCFEMVKDKYVSPSMRSLQFGGAAIEAHNARIYNCGVRHIDSLRAFAEAFYCLLSGTGTTFGLSEKFLSRLPDLVDKTNKTGSVLTYTVEDTIEGWADSIEALLMCYFKNTPFSGRKIVFDYSKVRPKNSPLKTGGGKAPGHEGLKAAHIKIKILLDSIIESFHQQRLKTINAYDVLMHCSDAVLSGGIRRAATMVIFMPDDYDMMTAKTDFVVDDFWSFAKNRKGFWEGYVSIGSKEYKVCFNKSTGPNAIENNEYAYKYLIETKKIGWIHIEPQRARSNNSVLFLRDQLTKEDFAKHIEHSKLYGDPGFILADHIDFLVNPCITKDTLIKTERGNLTVLEIEKLIEQNEAVFAVSYNESTEALEYKQILWAGKTKEDAEILEIESENGDIIKLTPDHKIFVENKGWIKASDLKEDDVIISLE